MTTSFLKHLCLQMMWAWAVISCLVIYASLLWPIFGAWLVEHAERAMAVAIGGRADLDTLRQVLAELVPMLIWAGLIGHVSRATAHMVMAPIFDHFANQ